MQKTPFSVSISCKITSLLFLRLAQKANAHSLLDVNLCHNMLKLVERYLSVLIFVCLQQCAISDACQLHNRQNNYYFSTF